MSAGNGRGSYESTLAKLLFTGERRTDRTGTGTRSLFGEQLRFDLNQGFPLITTKKIHFKSVAVELLWMLRGGRNVKDLQRDGVTIWDEWANEQGDLGPIYGVQWRQWGPGHGGGLDQIMNLLDGLTRDPYSRRHLVSAWNVEALDDMALAPCHVMFQCYVSADQRLSLQVYQRSADFFLGVPFNIASYALLTHLLAAQSGLGVGELVWSGGDTHLYENHLQQAETQLQRTIRPFPQLQIDPNVASLFDYELRHLQLVNYDPHPAIAAPVAV